MGRPRTSNPDLPRNTTRVKRDGALRYRRPDNSRDISLTPLGNRGAEMATVLNEAFGHTPVRGNRLAMANHARRFNWGALDQELLSFALAKLPDIVPLQRGNPMQEAQRHSWAYDIPSPAAFRHKIGALGPSDLRSDSAWIRGLFTAARKNAAARGHKFALTIEDVAALVANSRGRCAVTGIALSNERGDLPTGRRMRRPWAPSIDRMDSSKGYELGNCRIVCCAANYAMSQWGEAVLLEMAKSIARKRIRRMDVGNRVVEG